MKLKELALKTCRLTMAAWCAALLAASPPRLHGCMGTRLPTCMINPSACLKSMVLTKAVPTGSIPVPFGGPAMATVAMNLFLTCPETNNCGQACNPLAAPTAASISIDLYGPYPDVASCPPVAPLPPPVVTYAISTTDPANPMALPLCTAAGANNSYALGFLIPAGTPPGIYCAVGTAQVAFSDGLTLTQTGDTIICLVDEAPELRGVPRLELELLSERFPLMAPGDQTLASYRVTNNDSKNSVRLNAFATSRQGAVRPQGGNERQGVFAVSSAFGDDFPILLNADNGCVPLPEHPYTQPEICGRQTVLEPGKSATITVAIRSYGQCANGSCSESTLRVEGTFSDGTPALACAGMSLLVDTSQPSRNCGQEVNDCNKNGIPDAEDIASRRSSDQNFNAVPDECEEIISVPIIAGVNPGEVRVGAPVRVQIAFNEMIPMEKVWANGSPLVRTQSFGVPVWVGLIAADTRPGPQTVSFLAKDIRGGLASQIALYETKPGDNTRFGGFNQYPLGEAKAGTVDGQLFLSNIGSSGQDGVAVELGGTKSFGMVLAPVDLNNPGAALHLSAAGVVDRQPNMMLGQVSLVNRDGLVEVLADYRATGDPHVLVEVWKDGEFVGSSTMEAGSLGFLRGKVYVTRVGKFGPTVFPYCIPVDFLEPIMFIGADQKRFEGNQLRLLSKYSTRPIGALSRFFLQAADIGGSLAVLNEYRTDPFGLSIARQGNNVVVSWAAPNYVLEMSSALGNGPQPLPWVEVFTATSPHVVSQLSGQQFFRLRRDVVMPGQPSLPTPPVLAKTPLDPNPAVLPKDATGQLPSFDGDPLFVHLPVEQTDRVSADEVMSLVIEPILRAVNFPLGNSNTLSFPPNQGINQPRSDLAGIAQAVQYEYDNNRALAGPRTADMLNVLLGLKPPDAAIDEALLMGEGMTYAQFKAGVERLEIIYPFQQTYGGVPIEHAMLIASRWEGQNITSVYGSLLNHYLVDNEIRLTGAQAIIQQGIEDLSRLPGILCDPPPFYGSGPVLVLLPYGSDVAGHYKLRYAYRLILGAFTLDGPNSFLIWLDAQTAQIIRMEAQGYDVSATGRTFKQHPGLGTTTTSFQVDAAAGGQYVLKAAGIMNRLDYREDGYNAQDVSISSTLNGSSATLANFDQAPINNAANAQCSSGGNVAFQQVNLFASVMRYRGSALSLGIFTPYPFDFNNPANALAWTPAVEIPGYCNANGQYLRFGACQGYYDPACPNYTTGDTSSANWMNFAHDNTVIAHEMGHSIMRRFTQLRPPNWCGGGVCTIPVGWINLHDLADFWADHFESCNCAAGWVAKNTSGVNQGLNCGTYHSEGGLLPRLHQVTVPFNPGSPGDHFPEHRMLSTHAYGDGQIGAAALWQVRLGMRSKCRPSGVIQFGVRFARAIKRTGFFPAPTCEGHNTLNPCSDAVVYQYLYDLLVQLTDEWALSGSPMGAPAFAHNGPHTTSKVLAGFAKAGIFLIPQNLLDGNPAPADNGGDAVIDIDDNTPGDDYMSLDGSINPEVDFLRLGGPAPTFHVWTGPRYRLSGAGGSATFNNPAPCNTKFRVEVSTDMTFPGASTINSPWTDVDTNPATAGSPEGYGTWTPTPAQWTTLQAGGAGTRIYYRARTRNAADANERLSTMPGNGTWTVPPPYSVITPDGKSDY